MERHTSSQSRFLQRSVSRRRGYRSFRLRPWFPRTAESRLVFVPAEVTAAAKSASAYACVHHSRLEACCTPLEGAEDMAATMSSAPTTPVAHCRAGRLLSGSSRTLSLCLQKVGELGELPRRPSQRLRRMCSHR